MIGAIIVWSGSIAGIPSNWHLCDGTFGTVDLRNRFVRCAENQGAIGNTGGQDSQIHTFTGDGHSHTLRAAPTPQIPGAGAQFRDDTNVIAVTGATDATENRPVFKELAYIQRIA